MDREHEPSATEDLLAEALGEVTPEEDFDLAEPAPASTPVPQQGGYGPLIEKKRREVKALEEKIRTQDQTGVYVVKGDDGQEYINHMAFNKDMIEIGRLNREIGEFRDRQMEAGRESQTRQRAAVAMARRVLEKELLTVPEALRKQVTDSFVAIFQGLSRNREWDKATYADKNKLAAALVQVVDTAIGNAQRSSWAGASPSGSPDAAKEPVATEDDGEDDFTNNLMYAFEHKRRGSMTVAEAKAAARAAKTGGNT